MKQIYTYEKCQEISKQYKKYIAEDNSEETP